MISESIRWTGQALSRSHGTIEFGIAVSFWALSITVVNPVGEFPIIDDGLYEYIVKHVLTTGEFPNPEPASATLVTNIYWGAAFCLWKGASFTMLRVSTLVASLLGLFGLLELAKDFGISFHFRILMALTLAFAPTYHALSYSFMTDVPFTALVIWSSVFFVRSLNSGSLIYLSAATLLTIIAVLSRQIALSMPVAHCICLYLKDHRRLSWTQTLRLAVPVFLPAAALWEYFHILSSTHRLPITYNFFSNIMMSTLTHSSALAKVPFINLYATVMYLGLFLLPVLLALVGGPFRYRVKTFWFLFSVGLGLTVTGALIRLKSGLSDAVPLPESHVLVPSGIGLLWLRGDQSVPVLPAEFWALVTLLAVLGSVLLLVQLSALGSDLVHFIGENSWRIGSRAGVLYLALSGLILLYPYLFAGTSDRYLTPALPLLAVAIAGTHLWRPREAGRLQTLTHASAIVALIGTVIFSVVGTRDYLAWHRVTSFASRGLIDGMGVPPEHIDGGEEFNAYYPTYQGHESEIEFSDLDHDPSGYVFNDEIKRQNEAVEREAWRPANVQYVVGFDSIPGYSIIQEYSYYNWMPPHRQRILVLRRN